MSTLEEFFERTGFLFEEDIEYSQDILKQHLFKQDFSNELLELSQVLTALDSFTAENIENAFRCFAQDKGLKASDLIHPVRVAISADAVGPGLFETIEVLGKERLCNRLEKASVFIKSHFQK